MRQISFAIPFANIGRCTSRTFPSIGRTRDSTPFSLGVNCKASIKLKQYNKHFRLECKQYPETPMKMIKREENKN